MIGHRSILNRLQTEVNEDRLSHAYLFLGPKNVGKGAMAQFLAHEVLGDHPELSGDFWHFQDDGGTLGIDTVRAMLERCGESSWSGHRVVILENVGRLRPETLNALLKTLEEPSAGTHFILTAHREADVLETLKSRCRVLRFSRVPEVDFRAAGYDQPWIQMAHGRPGLLQRLMTDSTYQNDALRFHMDFRAFLKTPSLPAALALVRALDAREDARDWLDVFLDLAREEGGLQHHESALRASYDEVQSWNSSAHAKLALDSVFLPWVV